MNLDFLSKPAVLAATVAAFVAATFYYVIDLPDGNQAVSLASADVQPMPSAGTNKKAGSVTSLVGGLEAKLAENPNDGKGWLLLAKSHDHLGDQRAAWAAYARAMELGMSDDTFEIQLAANMNQLVQEN
jgi:cytochrome c-type biogenesis protein CcmH/NrfG